MGKTETDEIRLYNSMVMGIQNYYRIAASVNIDRSLLDRAATAVSQVGSKRKKATD